MSLATRQAAPLPPFGNQIDRGDDLVMVYCGRRAWKLAASDENRVASLAYPKGRTPAEFHWPVHSKEVLVLACGEPRREVDVLIIELLRQGATAVIARYSENDLVRYDAKVP